MYKKFLLFIVPLVLVAVAFPKDVSAKLDVVSNSASVKKKITANTFDYRAIILKKYLEKHNSPIADQAEFIVETADKYNIDYRLVPAISGVESTFGKRMPSGSYNAYGWANGKYKFKSWQDSILIVSSTLRNNYYNKGADTIAKISRRYAPPSSTWGGKVEYFMGKIDPVPLDFEL